MFTWLQKKPVKILSLLEGIESLKQKLPTLLNSVDQTKDFYRLDVAIESVDPIAFLDQQNCQQKFYWADRRGKFQIAGVGAADHLLVKADDVKNVWGLLKERMGRDQVSYFGGWAFDEQNFDQNINEKWRNFGAAQFILPAFAVWLQDQKTFLSWNFSREDLELSSGKLFAQLESLSWTSQPNQEDLPAIKDQRENPSYKLWEQWVQSELARIEENTSFKKIVLAREIELTFAEQPNPWGILQKLQAATQSCYLFAFQPAVGEVFLGASPERLYLRSGEKIETEALAGTQSRGKEEFQDQVQMLLLRESKKDNLEHRYVVDMIERKLKSFCEEIKSQEKPEILSLRSSHHFLTRFQGKLRPEVSDEELFANFHPTPAVAGEPPEQARERIRNIETFQRGWYCGPIGYLSHDKIELAVAIRCGLLRKENLSLFAGAGIVKGSVAKEEWQETEHKLKNFLNVIDPSYVIE